MSMDYESTKYSGIAWLSGVYVPFPHSVPILCALQWEIRKKKIILCAIYNLNVLKD